jgi:hypothetical protein
MIPKPQKDRARSNANCFHTSGLISEKILEGVRQNFDEDLGEGTEEQDKNRQRLTLALHCLACARKEIGQEPLEYQQVQKWLFSLDDQIPLDIWCRLAESFYVLGLAMKRESAHDQSLLDFCSLLSKPVHEHHQARRFIQEEFVRKKLALNSLALLESAGFQKDMIRIHLRREAERAAH